MQNLVNTSHSFELFCPSYEPLLDTDIVDGILSATSVNACKQKLDTY